MSVYKVVARACSTMACPFRVSRVVRGKAKTFYIVGEKATPPPWLAKKGYGLFAFNTLEHAVHTFDLNDIIMECEAGPEVPVKTSFIEDLENGKIVPYPDKCVPVGTKTFAWLMPIREVPPEEKYRATEIGL